MLGILVLLSFMPILYTAMLGSTFPPRAPSPTHFSLSLSLSLLLLVLDSRFSPSERQRGLCAGWLASEQSVPLGLGAKTKQNGTGSEKEEFQI